MVFSPARRSPRVMAIIGASADTGSGADRIGLFTIADDVSRDMARHIVRAQIDVPAIALLTAKPCRVSAADAISMQRADAAGLCRT